MENNNEPLDSFPKPHGNGDKSFAKGVFYVFIYYVGGMAAAGVAYLVVGHPYIHAPGLYHWIIALTFLGGAIWMLAAAVSYLTKERTAQLGGVVITNVLAVFGCAVFLYAILHASDESDTSETSTDEMILSSRGDTATLTRDGDIIYMRVGDSVLLNFMDSTRQQTGH
jgi:hypothetical protein